MSEFDFQKTGEIGDFTNKPNIFQTIPASIKEKMNLVALMGINLLFVTFIFSKIIQIISAIYLYPQYSLNAPLAVFVIYAITLLLSLFFASLSLLSKSDNKRFDWIALSLFLISCIAFFVDYLMTSSFSIFSLALLAVPLIFLVLSFLRSNIIQVLLRWVMYITVCFSLLFVSICLIFLTAV